ncbi:MAG: cytochrome C [Ignavibacteriae bacterium]|nr:cytochrome C [Ignavibacteriota bacterium]
MRLKKFYILFLTCALLFISLTAYMTKSRSLKNIFTQSQNFFVEIQSNKDVIKFNHALHIKDAGLTCKDCHGAALESGKATDNLNPKMEKCASCHDVKDQKECKLCHYDGVYKSLGSSGKELNFSHKFHVGKKMECTTCHTGIEKVKYAGESASGFPKMESCYTCHDSKTAVNNCEACHTNLTNLKPVNHLNSNFLNEHKLVYDASTGRQNDNCMMCHSSYFCEACHQPVKYQGENTPKNFYAPYYTKDFATRTDRENLQKLTTVHSLNYQFTHGLDAGQKSFECKSCHDPVQFCASCHQNRGNLQTGFAPGSHLQPKFVTYGVNTGGGLHAELGRKDIESCESCHSVQGGDPTCVKCHIDNDGIKGTNPKTHETGFMRDEKGNWHNTQGSICFTCHVDANARPTGNPGIGFCGYCHGKSSK